MLRSQRMLKGMKRDIGGLLCRVARWRGQRSWEQCLPDVRRSEYPVWGAFEGDGTIWLVAGRKKPKADEGPVHTPLFPPARRWRLRLGTSLVGPPPRFEARLFHLTLASPCRRFAGQVS